jgi:hypothetical protein
MVLKGMLVNREYVYVWVSVPVTFTVGPPMDSLRVFILAINICRLLSQTSLHLSVPELLPWDMLFCGHVQ